jgi:perosamine synthetase
MRRERAARYDRGLSDLVGVPPSGEGIENVYQMYTVLLGSREDRDGLREHLMKDGIASKVYFHPVHLEEYYVLNYEGCRGMLPRTEDLSGRVLTLPLYPSLTDEESDRIVTSVREYLEGGGPP